MNDTHTDVTNLKYTQDFPYIILLSIFGITLSILGFLGWIDLSIGGGIVAGKSSLYNLAAQFGSLDEVTETFSSIMSYSSLRMLKIFITVSKLLAAILAVSGLCMLGGMLHLLFSHKRNKICGWFESCFTFYFVSMIVTMIGVYFTHFSMLNYGIAVDYIEFTPVFWICLIFCIAGIIIEKSYNKYCRKQGFFCNPADKKQ